MSGSEGTTLATSATTLVPSQLASLVPTYDPSKDDLEIYTQKVELLTTTWPSDKFGELATRLVLGCSGTAFLKLQQHRDVVTVNDKKSVQKIIEILGGQWGQIPLERKYEAAERALYRCSQRSDETNDSFLARADVLWQELLNKNIKIEELQAYVTLRGSNLGPDDKKKVIMDCDSSDGKLSMKKVASAVRMLGAGFFHEMTTGKRTSKLKVYDQAVLMAEDEDHDDGLFQAYGEEVPGDDDLVESLAGDGDDDALLVMEFESAASELVQEDTELAAAFNPYTEARRRLSEKFKHRGFFPSSGGKGKNRFSKGGKGKGFKSGFSARKSLQQRILNSTCRICGRKGHWKAECPNRGDGVAGNNAGSSGGSTSLNSSFTGSAITPVPEGLSLEFLNLQEFGTATIDEVSVHEEFVLCGFGEYRRGLKNALEKVRNSQDSQTGPLVRQQISLRSEDSSCFANSRDRVANHVESEGILPETADSWVATAYSIQAKGVLDSGATKTVIGSQLVDSLLRSLDPDVRKRVTRSPCQVTFRFGNLSTLDAHHALVIPVGSLNLRVAIVPGSTPFLISNTLVRALRSIVDTHHQKLHSPFLKQPLNLELTERGLFLMDINELVKASIRVSHRSAKQDTFVTEDVQKNYSQSSSCVNQSQGIPSKLESEISNHMSEDINNQLVPKVISNNSSVRNSPIVQPSVEVQSSVIDSSRDRASSCGHDGQPPSAPQEASCRSSKCGGGRPEQVFDPPTAGDEDRFRHCPQGQNVSPSVEGSPILGEVVHRTLWPKQEEESSPCDPLLLTGDRALRDDQPSSADDRHAVQGGQDAIGSTQAQVQESSSSNQCIPRQDRVGAGMGTSRSRDGPRGPDCPAGGEPESRDQPAERSYEPDGRHVESNCSTSPEAIHGFSTRSVDAADLAWLTLHAGDSDAVDSSKNSPTENLSVDQKHFQRLVNQYTKECQECRQHVKVGKVEKHVLFEVFCGPQSPLVQQCQNLRGKAQRFCRERGDLQSVEGRKELFLEMYRCQPEHIWFSPSCNPWCGFSTLNGSRSLQAWDDLQSNRRHHLEQVALGLVLLRFQIENQRHLHWEQPRTSVMFRLPVLKELYAHSMAAEFDMCQFGLRDPNSQELIKKGMIVRTTSNKVFQTIHGRKCPKDHQHQIIEGSVISRGARVNRSQYTERYPRRFARTIVLALDKTEASALASSSRQIEIETAQTGRLSKRFRAHPNARAKGELSRVIEPSTQLHPKRRRIEGKHDAAITVADGWRNVVTMCSKEAPRVGKVVLEDPNIIQCVQDLIPDKKVCFLVAGRGSDRTMPRSW